MPIFSRFTMSRSLKYPLSAVMILGVLPVFFSTSAIIQAIPLLRRQYAEVVHRGILNRSKSAAYVNLVSKYGQDWCLTVK